MADNDNGNKGVWDYTLGWSFMQEPLWRWFVFMLALGLMATAWNSVLRGMKGLSPE